MFFGPLGLLLPNNVPQQTTAPTASPLLIVQPSIIALAPGASATITVSASPLGGPNAVPPGQAILASSNLNTVSVQGTGATPGPVAFVVTAARSAIGTALVSFSIANVPAFSLAPALPVAIVPMSPNVPQGRSSTQMLSTIRRRTNSQFGEPADASIISYMNDGLEEVTKRLDPIVATCALPIVAPQTNIMALPQDMGRMRDANYSTGNPALGGTVVYELQELDYDVFIQQTAATPAGGIGGIPAIFSRISDQAGVQMMQIYPFANSGFVNLHYYKRPILYYLPLAGQPPSYTDLDTLFQMPVMNWAMACVCEEREDTATAKYYFGLFERDFDESIPTSALAIVKKRARKRGGSQVRDVSQGESVIPMFMR